MRMPRKLHQYIVCIRGGTNGNIKRIGRSKSKLGWLLILTCTLVSNKALAVPDAGIGTPLQQALWKVAAKDHLRNHPELFDLAVAFLGFESTSLLPPTSANARVIPNFDPVAAALLRLKIMPPQASVENKQLALGASDAALSTMADALYNSVLLNNSSERETRLAKSLVANPEGSVVSEDQCERTPRYYVQHRAN